MVFKWLLPADAQKKLSEMNEKVLKTTFGAQATKESARSQRETPSRAAKKEKPTASNLMAFFGKS